MGVTLDPNVDWDAIDYLLVPKFIVRADVSHGAALLYAFLLEYGFRGVKVRQHELAENLRRGERQVRILLSELIAAGFVEVVRSGLGEPNGYRIFGPDRRLVIDAEVKPRCLDERGIDRKLWRQTRLEVLEERGTVCVYCGVDAGDRAHLDHIRPVSKGGAAYDRDNLAVACGSCNSRKGDRPVECMQ